MNPLVNDTEFEETTIESVETFVDYGWNVRRADGWSIWVTNEHETRSPMAGETMRLYGRGIGYPVRGIVIGSRVYRYESPEEHEAASAAALKRMDDDRKKRDEEFRASLHNKPALPAFAKSDPEKWAKCVEVNSADPYSYACVEFAATWAAMMEAQLASGESFPVAADTASKEADTGITGFMYGCAVNMLVHCWERGEELRRWHNKEYGVESESGVVNPEILTVSE